MASDGSYQSSSKQRGSGVTMRSGSGLPRRQRMPTITPCDASFGLDPAQIRHDACMPVFDMPSIIKPNTSTPELPDFRNLGTILRIVLAVNLITAVAALVRE